MAEFEGPRPSEIQKESSPNRGGSIVKRILMAPLTIARELVKAAGHSNISK